MPVSVYSAAYNQSPIGPSTAAGATIVPGTNTFSIGGDFSALADAKDFKVEFDPPSTGTIDNNLNQTDEAQSNTGWLVGTFVYQPPTIGRVFVGPGGFTVTVTDPADGTFAVFTSPASISTVDETRPTSGTA